MVSEVSQEKEPAEDFEVEFERICEKYPELADGIKRSLEAPQLGSHHNEGPRMESHLRLMLQTVEDIKQGKFHESVAGNVSLQEALQRVALNPEIIDYVFLHDIAKPDSLSLKIEGEKKPVEITWDQWKEVEINGEPYQFQGKPIRSISYYHISEGWNGPHGHKAAKFLKNKGVPKDILNAIENHEVAYQFTKVNPATYKKFFLDPGFSHDQQDFILAGSYIDNMSALTLDGKPDLQNFMNLVDSREAALENK